MFSCYLPTQPCTHRLCAQARELGKAITQALNATTEAQVRLNATTQALNAVEQEKTSELLAEAAKLAQQAEREEKEERGKEKYDAQVAGRKEGLGVAVASGSSAAGKPGTSGGATGTAAQGGGSSGSSGNATAGGAGKPLQEARETLKAAAAAAAGGTTVNVSAVNVTAVAQATIEAASGVVASSKEKVEETIERKKPEVRHVEGAGCKRGMAGHGVLYHAAFRAASLSDKLPGSLLLSSPPGHGACH